ncbi:hypothetical protein OF83DRAFT_1170778 [Amylostereum chailletii]|nr:hypothetical protein OF83DRAFT_1170778 [Amylostereum chailletii]
MIMILGVDSVVSDSFPYRESATESFNTLRGQHGISDLVCGFTPDRPLFIEEHVHRNHRTLQFPTAVKSLLADEVTLIDSIYVAVDAMIALSNAYFFGFLHGEPSITNILIREAPEKRTLEMIQSNACLRRSSSEEDFTFLEKHLQQCKGMIINADLAVRHDSSRAVARRLSTVLPFASRRQLDAWMEAEPGSPGPPHTLLDDIEGVLWIVMWKIVTHADRERREMVWHKALSSDDVSTVNHTKHAIVAWFNDRGHTKKVEKQVGVMARPVIFWGTIYDIMKEWMTIAKQARLDVEVFESDNDEYPDVIKALTLEHLTMYLKAGVEFLEKSGQYRDGAE